MEIYTFIQKDYDKSLLTLILKVRLIKVLTNGESILFLIFTEDKIMLITYRVLSKVWVYWVIEKGFFKW